MSDGPTAIVRQVGPSTGEGSVRGHTVLVDRPASKDGNDRGPMGGELMLIGLAGCFLSNLLAAIRARGADVSNVVIHAEAETTGTPSRMSAFTLRVAADYEDDDLMQKLLTVAERGCIASNTLKEGCDLTVLLEEV